MNNTVQSLKYFTVTIFLLSFTIHFSYIVHFILNPEFPDVRVYNAELVDIEMPISFQFCVHRKDTEKKFLQMGYQDISTFYKGRSFYNSSIYGWLGHKKDGGTFKSINGKIQILKLCIMHFTIFTFSDVLNKAFFDWKKFKIIKIKILSLKSEDEDVRMFEISGNKVKWSEVPIYPECQTLDLSDYFDLSQITPLEIRFYIDNNPNIGLGFFIEERNKVLKRRLSSFNILSYSGPDIESKNLSIGKDIKAVISLSQIKDLEEDTEKKCKNYPISGFENMNKTFEDYNACDLEFAYQKLKSVYQLTPFWATYNMSEVTASKVMDKEPFTLEAVDGTFTSKCYHPCLTTKVR